MNIPVTGAMVNSALYLASVFIAGMILGNTVAWTGAIAAMGVTYLSYLAAIPRLRSRDDLPWDPTPMIVTPKWQIVAQPMLTAVSIALAAAAGISLLF